MASFSMHAPPSVRWHAVSGVSHGPEAGQLAAGARAGPGLVGYLGNEGDLITLNAGDPLGALTGSASWDGGVLRITASPFTLQGYKIPGVYTTITGILTVRNCVIDRNGSNDVVAGVYNPNETFGQGRVEVYDTTIRDSAPNSNGGVCVRSDSGETHVERCDLSGFEDGVHGGGSMYVRQCYLHHFDGTGVDPHNDGTQMFPNGQPGAVIEKNYISMSEYGTTDDPCTGRSACTGAKTEDAPTINDNYLNHGPYILRIEGATNCVVTNNNFGPSFDFGEVTADLGFTISTWSNNRDYNGNLIPQP